MKKIVIYTVATLLLTIIVVGATYAYFTAAVNSNTFVVNSAKLDVIYTGGKHIEGKINLTSTKEQGLSTTVNIRFAEGSVQELGDIFMEIENITSNIAIPGFKWEVYGYKNNTLVYEDNGTFSGKQNGDTFNLVNDYAIDYVDTSFTIYIWLDGNMVGNEVLGGEFKATIHAKTEQYTSLLE